MSWFGIFSLAIFVIVLIRLFLIMAGEMTAREKLIKSSSWLIGLILLYFSWNVVIKGFFPHYADRYGTFKVGAGYNDLEQNRNNRNERMRNETDSVYIRIDTGRR